MQHDRPPIVIQFPLEPPHASSWTLTAPLLGCLGSRVRGPDAGPLRPKPQGMLGHTEHPQPPGTWAVPVEPSPLYARDWKLFAVLLNAEGKFSM
jgi:hypothetical protein